MRIMSVVGARPNFMKIAPFIRAIEDYNNTARKDSQPAPFPASHYLHHILVHTGQHYDDQMSRAFFEALDIPDADINLGVGSGSHAEQVGQTMIEFEEVLRREAPDWVVVVGDVNATCACAITAKKEQVKLAHIEAGLRSRDMTMPEEINRLVTDRLADLLLTPDELASENLLQEGIPKDRIKLVGNIMIDTLEANRERAERLSIEQIVRDNSLHRMPPFRTRSPFAVLTLHRPANVDKQMTLKGLIDFFCTEVCADMPLIWPIHPRTLNRLKGFGLWSRVCQTPNLFLLSPIGYQQMLRLNIEARIMFTDSGGLQEECCVLGTQCLTLRWNTERPITLEEYGGASVLVGNDTSLIRAKYKVALKNKCQPRRPRLWDGQTAGRIVQAIVEAGTWAREGSGVDKGTL